MVTAGAPVVVFVAVVPLQATWMYPLFALENVTGAASLFRRALLQTALPFLKPGSYVGFHDALVDPREDSAVKKIRAQHPSWEYIRFFSARGVDLMRVQ